MNFKSFFDSAREAANENFYNMDGFDDEFDFVDDEFDNAAGGVGGASVSQPYIVRLVNTTLCFHFLTA